MSIEVNRSGLSEQVAVVATPTLAEASPSAVMIHNPPQAVGPRLDLLTPLERLIALAGPELPPVAVVEEQIDAQHFVMTSRVSEILGLGTSSASWTELIEGIHPEDRRRFEETRTERWVERQPYLIELRLRRSQQAEYRWYVWRSEPRHDALQKFSGYWTVLEDIDDRKQLEIDLIDLNTTLEQRVIERTRELETFTFSISQDLNAPMRAVAGFVRQLRERETLNITDESRLLLSRTSSSIERMTGLLQALARFAHASVGEVTRLKVDLQVIAKEVLDRLYGGHQNLEYQIKAMPLAYVDPVLFEMVYENLIENALKFSRSRPLSRLEIGHDGRTYYVSDNGVGFDAQEPRDLFKPFQRLNAQEDYEGFGVGLAIVKKVIDRHGGRIWAESVEGTGTTFRFFVPG